MKAVRILRLVTALSKRSTSSRARTVGRLFDRRGIGICLAMSGRFNVVPYKNLSAPIFTQIELAVRPGHKVQLIFPQMLHPELVGRSPVECTKLRYSTDVRLLAARRQVAHRHVVDHALAQRRDRFAHLWTP